MLSFMARAPKEVPTPSPLVPAIARWVGARGLDAAGLLERSGLPPAAQTADEWPITPQALDELLETAAALTGEPFVALRLPGELSFARYGMHELLARAMPTVGAALQELVRYAPLIHPRLELRLETAGAEAEWRTCMLGYPRGVGRFADEYAVAAALAELRRYAGESVAARRVWFMHARPRELGPLSRFFGTRELDFGCDDHGFTFDGALLARPLPSADPRLAATVAPLAEAALRAQPRAADFAGEVAARIRALLPEAVDAAQVAKALHMSARTLQRRLGEAGTQFSEVLDGVRADEAKRALLSSAVPLAEIAWKLGFADLATFSRAFKRWTGLPPGTFRRQR